MTKPADFMVVLRSDTRAEDLELLSPVVHALTLKSGNIANVLWCKTVDSADGGYLHAEAKLTASGDFTHIKIPHWLVLTIVGAKNSPPVGFLWAQESKVPDIEGD